MLITKLSIKGQVIIPKALREEHHWHAGLEFTVTDHNDGILLKPINPHAGITLDAVLGCTNYKGPKKSLQDMEKAIQKGLEKHDKH